MAHLLGERTIAHKDVSDHLIQTEASLGFVLHPVLVIFHKYLAVIISCPAQRRLNLLLRIRGQLVILLVKLYVIIILSGQ